MRLTRGGRPCPYGLLLPVARVATDTAAEEIRRFLDICGIRSTTAPCSRRRSPWRLQVLVFAEDAGRARCLVDEWTLPADTPPPERS